VKIEKEEERLEFIFKALKNKIPAYQISTLLDGEESFPPAQTGKYSEEEIRIKGVISLLEIVESVEKPDSHEDHMSNYRADFLIKVKSAREKEKYRLIVRPGRGGIRRYRNWFRNINNLGQSQTDEFLQLEGIVLINARLSEDDIKNSFLNQIEKIDKTRQKLSKNLPRP